jgi:hypothetical protein
MRADSVFEENIALDFIEGKTFADIMVQSGLHRNSAKELNDSIK